MSAADQDPVGRRTLIVLVTAIALGALAPATARAAVPPVITIESVYPHDMTASIDVAISNVGGLAGWRVEFGTAPGALTRSTPTVTTSRHVWLRDLTPSTTYYYRATATGSSGSGSSSVASFTTDAAGPPYAELESPEDRGVGYARLIAVVSAGTDATLQFRWKRRGETQIHTSPWLDLAGPADRRRVEYVASGLLADSEFEAWITVVNGEGVTEGGPHPFWTDAPVAPPRGSVLHADATHWLRVDVDFDEWPNSWIVEYGTDPAYGSTAVASMADSTLIPVHPRVAPGAWYFARVVTRGRGTDDRAYGPAMRALSLAEPVADTVVDVTATSATFHGRVVSAEAAEWRTVVQSAQGSRESEWQTRSPDADVAAHLTDLQPSTTYAITLEARNTAGTTASTAVEFTTRSVGSPAAPVAAPPGVPPGAPPRSVAPRAITGSHRADTYRGTAGPDLFHGLRGNDSFAGGAGNDEFHGGAGNDRAAGDAGDDRLDGDAGNDRLVGGAGQDRLRGGAGDDVLETRDGRRGDIADCGAGRLDRAVIDRGDVARGCERIDRPARR